MTRAPAPQHADSTAEDRPRRKARDPQEREALGRAARKRVPRRSHAAFEPRPDRADPVDLLVGQAADRVPELLPIRYGRMSVSPFTFFRGAALVMASDLAHTPVSGFDVQLCGDAHLSNFGGFASPERRLVFDLNDFDETLPGPWEWDVKRLAASLEIAARESGRSAADSRKIVVAAVRAYRLAMRRFAGMTNLQVWYAHTDATVIARQVRAQLDAADSDRLSRNLAKARTRDNLQAFERLTTIEDGELRFVSDPPLVERLDELLPDDVARHRLAEEIHELLRDYRATLQADRRTLLEGYRSADMARKVVGVGSVGTRCWIVLMFGRDERDPLILQAKEAGRSVLEGFLPASEYRNSGQRVVAGQRLMQASSDILLGWQSVHGIDGQDRDFYLRQLRDWKASANLDAMSGTALLVYGQLCGRTLARAHARSGDRIAIAAYLGSGDVFDQAVGEFAAAYAAVNERDHAGMLAAIEAGRVTARAGL